MDLWAIRINQNGNVLYLTSMTAAELVDKATPDEWNPALGFDLTTQGYQRKQKPDHVERIARYLANTPSVFMPNGALLAARESDAGLLPFTPLPGASGEYGKLTVSDHRRLWLVDYQHRWRGFMQAINDYGAQNLSSFRIPVTIIADIPRAEEIEQFYVINSKQRRVDTDLGLALIQTLAQGYADDALIELVGRDKRFRVRGTRITFRVAAQHQGPWSERIAQPHDLPQPNTSISITSFVDSMQPILSSRQATSRLTDTELIDRLTRFWEGIELLSPVPMNNPQSYQIQRTVGTFALHIVFAKKVHDLCVARQNFSPQAIESMMQPAKASYFTPDFWKIGGAARVFTGSSGYRDLASRIMALI